MEFWKSSESGPLTLETLEQAHQLVLKNSRTEPRHECQLDGHVIQFGSFRCIYCGSSTPSSPPSAERESTDLA